jgi:hypothetical protein
MSAIIHFTSGKKLEITELERQQLAPKLQLGGVRLYRTKDQHLIPLNSNTMEMIENIPEVEDIIEADVDPTPKAMNPGTPDPVPTPPVKAEDAKPESDIEAKKQSALESMIEKSNCKHEPEKLVMYMQSTAKGIRYFPVCSFCGKRERYVSEKKVRDNQIERWTGEDIDNAKMWIES